jgi:dTDP-4-dehydrorhamnose reductase
VILISGGLGQLGQELARAAALRRIPATALSRAQLDIANSSDVSSALSYIRPAIVVNAAAYTKVDLAETNIEEARRVNEIGPAVLASACAAARVPVIHLSTDYVFDGTKEDPYREADPVCPINVYGRTKAAGEQAVRSALDRHVILRTSWVYSEFGSNFLKTMLHLAKVRDELRVVADQRGAPTSSREVADVILDIAPRLVRGDNVWGTYHFTSGGVTTWHGFASRIVAVQAALTGRSPPVSPIATVDYPTAARRPSNSQLDCSLFAEVFAIGRRHWTAGVDATTKALLASAQRIDDVA